MCGDEENRFGPCNSNVMSEQPYAMSDDTSEDDPQLTGYACIQSYLKTLETSPGVYRMLDSQSRVLYVGKARNLRRGCRTMRGPRGTARGSRG